MKFTNYEFALMTRLNELGKSYGFEPWEWMVEYDRSTGETYISGTPSGAEAGERFAAMLKALGVPFDGATPISRTIPHEEGEKMFEAIDNAIKKSPRRWAR